MPRKIVISDSMVSWLHREHNNFTHQQLAERIGCCVDTMKRILMREGLQYFEGAKYVTVKENTLKMWTRPCMRCGCEKLRPKNKYICSTCWNREYEDT